jgi:hypothetical protein
MTKNTLRTAVARTPVSPQSLSISQQAQPSSQFDIASNELHDALSSLEEILQGLAHRLSPVCETGFGGNAGKDTVAPISATPALAILQATTSRLRVCYDQVQTLCTQLVI